MDCVIDLGIEHRLEDDLAGLLRREGFDRQLGVAERRGVELVQVLELAVEAAGQPGQRNVERVDVLVGVVRVHLDDERNPVDRARCRRPSARARR